MDSSKGVMASFLGCMVLITYRDFKKPDSSWPLGPVPPPYRFTWCAVIFGILSLVGDMFSERVATTVATGVLIGTLFEVITGSSASSGLLSQAPGYSDTHNPINNGMTGSSAIGAIGGSEQV